MENKNSGGLGICGDLVRRFVNRLYVSFFFVELCLEIFRYIYKSKFPLFLLFNYFSYFFSECDSFLDFSYLLKEIMCSAQINFCIFFMSLYIVSNKNAQSTDLQPIYTRVRGSLVLLVTPLKYPFMHTPTVLPYLEHLQEKLWR